VGYLGKFLGQNKFLDKKNHLILFFGYHNSWILRSVKQHVTCLFFKKYIYLGWMIGHPPIKSFFLKKKKYSPSAEAFVERPALLGFFKPKCARLPEPNSYVWAFPFWFIEFFFLFIFVYQFHYLILSFY